MRGVLCPTGRRSVTLFSYLIHPEGIAVGEPGKFGEGDPHAESVIAVSRMIKLRKRRKLLVVRNDGILGKVSGASIYFASTINHF